MDECAYLGYLLLPIPKREALRARDKLQMKQWKQKATNS